MAAERAEGGVHTISCTRGAHYIFGERRMSRDVHPGEPYRIILLVKVKTYKYIVFEGTTNIVIINPLQNLPLLMPDGISVPIH